MFDEEKRIIGYLINYYRMKAKISISDFTSYKSEYIKSNCVHCHKKCKQREAIVSHKTIERMNKGVIIKNECIYTDLAYKLDYHFQLSHRYSMRINDFAKRLLNLSRTKNKKGFIELKEKLEVYKKQVAQFIYYQDLATLFLEIIDVELNHKFCDKDRIKLAEYLYNYANGDLKKILIYYLARFYSRFPSTDKCDKYLIECCSVYKENVQNDFVVYSYQLNKFSFLNYMHGYDTSDFLHEDYFFYYSSISLGYMNLEDYPSALYYLDKSIMIARQRGMIDLYLIQSYMRRGVISYKMGKYKEALVYFRRVYQYDINVMMMNLILFFDCFDKTGKNDALVSLLKSENPNAIKSDMARATFIYYKMKKVDAYPDKVLEDYIVDILKPHLRSGSDYEKIIFNHLVEYTDKTHHFKKLHEFITKQEKK